MIGKIILRKLRECNEKQKITDTSFFEERTKPMIKNMIIAILLARVSMVYIFTEYSPLEEVTVFWFLAILSFVLILMIEDKIERMRYRRGK